jgi:hypothetical protein
MTDGCRPAIRDPSDARNDAHLRWSDEAADYAVEELIAGGLITRQQADFAQRIIAQQLHVLLIGGYPPERLLQSKCDTAE